MRRDHRSWLVLFVLLRGSLALAQPNEPTPPPPAPDPNWAPPQPVETPPPKEAAPPAEGEPAAAPAPQPAGQDANPDTAKEPETELEIYGFAMLDSGYDFGHIGDPNWYDTLRPTKLPSC